MGQGECGESDSAELQPILDELTEAARETHAELCAELPAPGQRFDPEQVDVEELQDGLETTRQYVRKLEQYVVALEEQAETE